MKFNLAVLTVLTISLALLMSFSAFGQDTRPYEKLLEQYVCKCDTKMEMKSSSLENVRRAAAIAMLKSTFAKTYRTELINGMIQDNVEPKPYKVQLYINERFYNVTRSKKMDL